MVGQVLAWVIMSTDVERFAVANFARECFTTDVVSRESQLSGSDRPRRRARAPRPRLRRRLWSARIFAIFCAIFALFLGSSLGRAHPIHALMTGAQAPARGPAEVVHSGPGVGAHRDRALPAEAECEPTDDAESEDSAVDAQSTNLLSCGDLSALAAARAGDARLRVEVRSGPSSFWLGARPARGPPQLV